MVDCESALEHVAATLIDFEGDTAAFSGQPFTVYGFGDKGGWGRTPDFFVRHRDGSATVIDVIPDEFVATSGRLRKSRRMKQVCVDAGWGYRIMSEPDGREWINVQFLSRFRGPHPDPLGLADAVLACCHTPRALGEVPVLVGAPAPLVRPQLFALCWHRQLSLPMGRRWTDTTLVTHPDVGAAGSSDGAAS